MVFGRLKTVSLRLILLCSVLVADEGRREPPPLEQFVSNGSKMRMKRLDIYIQFQEVNRETEDWAWD